MTQPRDEANQRVVQVWNTAFRAWHESLGSITSGDQAAAAIIAQYGARERMAEREAIVAWLRSPDVKTFGNAEGYCDLVDGTGGGHEGVVRDLRMFLRFFADAIERGEHHP